MTHRFFSFLMACMIIQAATGTHRQIAPDGNPIETPEEDGKKDLRKFVESLDDDMRKFVKSLDEDMFQDTPTEKKIRAELEQSRAADMISTDEGKEPQADFLVKRTSRKKVVDRFMEWQSSWRSTIAKLDDQRAETQLAQKDMGVSTNKKAPVARLRHEQEITGTPKAPRKTSLEVQQKGTANGAPLATNMSTGPFTIAPWLHKSSLWMALGFAGIMTAFFLFIWLRRRAVESELSHMYRDILTTTESKIELQPPQVKAPFHSYQQYRPQVAAATDIAEQPVQLLRDGTAGRQL